MPITIKAVRVTNVAIDLRDERKVSGNYELISSLDKVLARQAFGGYNDTALPPATDTQQALDNFLSLYQRDIKNALGLE